MTAGEKVDPAAAWVASCEAVRTVMGVAPSPPRTGARSDKATAWRRQLAIYTAAVSLDVGVKPLLPHVGSGRRTVRVILTTLEEARDRAVIDQLLDLLKAEAERQLARAERRAIAA